MGPVVVAIGILHPFMDISQKSQAKNALNAPPLPALATQSNRLFAGTGRRCTNPPPNIAHGGWGAQKHEQAEGIDLDLWVSALALSDQTTTALILDLAIQIITNDRADQIPAAVTKATAPPASHIR